MDQNITIVPVSVIIATANRPWLLERTLASLRQQTFQPRELIIIDASDNNAVKELLSTWDADSIALKYEKAGVKGAASQRNQGVEHSVSPFIAFLDDDIILEKDCFGFLFNTIAGNENVGGVNAFITNQHSFPPGKITRTYYRLISDRKLDFYDGKCFGPVINVLPVDYQGSRQLVEVEWLNSTCVIYRREALPVPVFDPHFTGYSFMEDVALSLQVGKKWQMYNVQTARIFHDSQQSGHKSKRRLLSKQQIVNRYYIMTRIMEKRKTADLIRLIAAELFGILSGLTGFNGWKTLIPDIGGKIDGAWSLIMRKGQ
ncbi:glycosyltransferase family 2 protein [Sediminibacterium ginsengisoli]|uniref:Glycosyltransferase, GT2 family n=1 Tax=Sediminibacterium ginsengisoli TaxID=413434 RepID=A0A1T4Q5Q1_9BACT|nr:glycosyltransferase family 2 protein [Sediminibacterium ginsengisoli]SJZ98994.1 Glycosyltransferase, GT2 family [Sediminibacterium ginsengisoli]